ncbi:hypothetical protein ACLBOM_36480 [Escherichia coli]
MSTTTAGQLSRTQGTTDQNGQLSVQLTSPRAGQAVVMSWTAPPSVPPR